MVAAYVVGRGANSAACCDSKWRSLDCAGSLGSNTRDFAANYEAIDIARRYPNVYLTTAALALSEYLEIAAKELGAGKLIFASDGPERDARVERHRVRLLKLRPGDEAMALGGNLERVLGRR